jgi:hypothetical protein
VRAHQMLAPITPRPTTPMMIAARLAWKPIASRGHQDRCGRREDGAARQPALGDSWPPQERFLDRSHSPITTARSGPPHSMLDKPAIAVITPIV